MMQLLTKELEKKFKKYPFGSQRHLRGEAHVLVKYFNGIGAGTWIITEARQLSNGDWELYGLCDLGTQELGTVLLSELEDLQKSNNPWVSIERDLWLPDNCTLRMAMKCTFIKEPKYLLEPNHSKKLLIKNIKWVPEDQEDLEDLPTNVLIPANLFDGCNEEVDYTLTDLISDWLSDEFGYLHDGFELEEINDEEASK